MSVVQLLVLKACLQWPSTGLVVIEALFLGSMGLSLKKLCNPSLLHVGHG